MIIEWLRRKRRQRHLYSIRRTMAFFGYDVSRFSDEELRHIVQRVNLIRHETGLSMEHAIKVDGELTKVLDIHSKRSTL